MGFSQLQHLWGCAPCFVVLIEVCLYLPCFFCLLLFENWYLLLHCWVHQGIAVTGRSLEVLKLVEQHQLLP